MHPDLELNPQTFGWWDGTPTNWATQGTVYMFHGVFPL